MLAPRGKLSSAFFAWHARNIHVPRIDRVAKALARCIGSAASVLDVGAGDGSMALNVGDRVGAKRVAGVDVLVRPGAAIPIEPYDGLHLPFPDRSFEAVLLSDVLHHATDAEAVLRESLRVSSRVVALKDHFRFGRVSGAILYAMDRVGNDAAGVPSPGAYLSAEQWTSLVDRAGGRIASIEWPLRIHDLPFRIITRDDYQFAAALRPR